MSNLIKKLSNKIFYSDAYNNARDVLFNAYVYNLINKKPNLEKAEVKKLLSAAQAFFSSEDVLIRQEAAIILAMLLDLYADTYKDLIPIAHNAYAMAGDFPNTQLLASKYPNLNFRLNLATEAQLTIREELNWVEELDFPLTDYQYSLWLDLISDRDVITSAPTSAGKTHIILNYLIYKILHSEGAFAAIIVPTRALISEVASKVYELIGKAAPVGAIEVCTVAKEGMFANKTIFVMTQERLHEILQRGDISFDYLFIDEAHNITDKSRGVLLHITIEKMLENSFPQVIISMPSANYQDSFSSIFKETVFTKEITSLSPVAKIIMSVTPKGKNLIISRHNSTHSMSIPKEFKGKKLSDIVYMLGKNESNIIYRNKTNYCEDFADEIAKLIKDDYEPNVLLEEAADYVEKFIHEEFSLARNLRKGVAFHYGPLPGSIRVMIENLAKDNQIQFISCTSTLAEGVNLPAKNLFLKNPLQVISMQPSERIEDVKINNITGRAGRMLQHFSGNIFLIEHDEWDFTDYFNDQPETEQKVPTYYKSLNEDFSSVIQALDGTYAHDESDQYRFYTIANKLIKEYANESIHETFRANEITLSVRALAFLESKVKSAYEGLNIAPITLASNPLIGYIQQNKLFNFLNEVDQLEQWTLPHPNSPHLYESLLQICYQLYEFGIFIPTKERSIEHICSIASKWIKGKSLKDMISAQIKRDREHSDKPIKVNTSVRNVISVINDDIRFRLSNAIRCYQVLLEIIMLRKDLHLTSIKLHSYIEVGASKSRIINLINLGLSREASIEVDGNLAKTIEINTSQDLLYILNIGLLDFVHPITLKELSKLLR